MFRSGVLPQSGVEGGNAPSTAPKLRRTTLAHVIRMFDREPVQGGLKLADWAHVPLFGDVEPVTHKS